jgi:hypothetical protein
VPYLAVQNFAMLRPTTEDFASPRKTLPFTNAPHIGIPHFTKKCFTVPYQRGQRSATPYRTKPDRKH